MTSNSTIISVTFICLLAILLCRTAPGQAADAPDRDGLQNLIRHLRDTQSHPDQNNPTSERSDATTDSPRGHSGSPPVSATGRNYSGFTVPTAFDIWHMNDQTCLNILSDAHIQTHKPPFSTPFVKTPLLLDSPVEGVVIDSRWPEKQMRRVMDCRLIVSLMQLARRARAAGVIKIEYYATWRPLTLAENCPHGLKGRKCRKAAEHAQNGHLPSQHSRATAIDIRWFTFADGSVVDVLEDYEMNFHDPPCDDHPVTREGQFLQKLVCDLHTDRVFNVMLTPNANREHENHFHFDITPNVNWYILR